MVVNRNFVRGRAKAFEIMAVRQRPHDRQHKTQLGFDLMSAQLGLGLAALGRPGYVTLNHAADLGGRTDPASMELHAHDVLDAAYDAGIRHIDAARSYGRAGDFLASWLEKGTLEPGD